MNPAIHDFEESITELDIEKATATCKELLKSCKPEELFDAIGRPLSVIGEKYEKGEYFLSELLMAKHLGQDGIVVTDLPFEPMGGPCRIEGYLRNYKQIPIATQPSIGFSSKPD